MSRNLGWKALVATRGNRRRLLIIVAIAWFSQWSGNGLVSYYLNKVFDTIGITSSTIQLLITAYEIFMHSNKRYFNILCRILAVWNLLFAITASFLVDRVGRRGLFLTATGGSLVFFVMQTVCSAQYAMHAKPAAAHAVIAFIFLYYAAYE